ncbi:MAG: hypothetical protein U0893_06085 [Chloroflexota bacterium]
MQDEADAAARQLLEMDPKAFLALAGLPTTGSVELIEAGVFPYVLPVDLVLRIPARRPWVGVIALVANRHPDLVGELLTTMASLPYDVPAIPIAVLVRPEADDPALSGEIVSSSLQFRYHVVRAWQSPRAVAWGDLGSKAMARHLATGLSDAISSLRERAARGGTEDGAQPMLCLAFALSSHGQVDPRLLADADRLEQLAPCVYLGTNRREDVRVASLADGCAVMRWKLYQRGSRRFGPPDAGVAQTIGAIDDPRRLTELDHFISRIDTWRWPISSWEQLLTWRDPSDETNL